MTSRRGGAPIRAYLCGPMRNIALSNFPAFDAAASAVRTRIGWEVVNPAEIDRAEGITGESDNDYAGLIYNFLRRDFREITDCDALILLPGWEDSRGARGEVAVALMLGLDLWQHFPDKNFLTALPADVAYEIVEGRGWREVQ